MRTSQQVDEIVTDVKQRLAAEKDVPLRVADSYVWDEWLYITVITARPGVRASDHASAMARVEGELRREGVENVLLVPPDQP